LIATSAASGGSGGSIIIQGGESGANALQASNVAIVGGSTMSDIPSAVSMMGGFADGQSSGGDINIAGGNSVGGQSGSVKVFSGKVGQSTGGIEISTSAESRSSESGYIRFTTGDAANISGDLMVATGNSGGKVGDLTLQTGSSDARDLTSGSQYRYLAIDEHR